MDRLRGRYITAEDAGTTSGDMEHVRRETRHVLGVRDCAGDPGPLTALGVFRAMQAAAVGVLGRQTLEGVSVAVEGLGNVGHHLCRLLAAEGAQLVVADVDPEKIVRMVDEHAAEPVPVQRIRALEVDIFAPCAVGSVVTRDSARQFRCRVIAGAANNQLGLQEDGDELARRGVVYLPDYVINAGGLLSVARELFAWSAEEARCRTFDLHDKVLDLIEEAKRTSLATHRIANMRVEATLRGRRAAA